MIEIRRMIMTMGSMNLGDLKPSHPKNGVLGLGCPTFNIIHHHLPSVYVHLIITIMIMIMIMIMIIMIMIIIIIIFSSSSSESSFGGGELWSIYKHHLDWKFSYVFIPWILRRVVTQIRGFCKRGLHKVFKFHPIYSKSQFRFSKYWKSFLLAIV